MTLIIFIDLASIWEESTIIPFTFSLSTTMTSCSIWVSRFFIGLWVALNEFWVCFHENLDVLLKFHSVSNDGIYLIFKLTLNGWSRLLHWKWKVKCDVEIRISIWIALVLIIPPLCIIHVKIWIISRPLALKSTHSINVAPIVLLILKV